MTKALNIQLNLTNKNKKLTNDLAIGICIKVLKGINGMTKSFLTFTTTTFSMALTLYYF